MFEQCTFLLTFLHIERYRFSMQEEEINKNNLKNKWSTNNKPNTNCRLCHTEKKTIQHVMAACPKLLMYPPPPLSSPLPPARHNKVGKIISNSTIARNSDSNHKVPPKEKYTDEFVETRCDTEIKSCTITNLISLFGKNLIKSTLKLMLQ